MVSMPAAVAYLLRAFPLLRPHVESVYLGASAPRLYGSVNGVDAADATAGAPARLWLEVQGGVQQGDPLGPLLHAAAMHLAVLRLAAAHPSAVVRAVHDDVVVVAPLEDIPAVITTAAAAGAAVDAELAPAKCAGWSPAGALAPAGWPARWHADGVRQLSIPLRTRGCHGYVPEEYIHALYPYPLRIRAGDAYSKCIMRKRGEDISILSDKNCKIISDPYSRYERQDTGIY